jgi:hypothetical protein
MCRRPSKNVEPERLGRFQLELRRRLIESGDFYIVSTNIDGIGALRVTIINPLTTPEDLDQLLDGLRFQPRAALIDATPAHHYQWRGASGILKHTERRNSIMRERVRVFTHASGEGSTVSDTACRT